MSKIFSIFTLVLFYSIMTFGQARVDIEITVSDNQGGLKVLNIGVDSLATTGLDPLLGEGDLPPFPPAGAFEARWNLQPFGVGTLSTYKDYRNAPSFPYSGTVTHRLIWQYTDLATQFSISYNLPQQATLLITSNNAVPIWTSGTLAGSGTYVIPDPDNEYSAARIYITYDAIIPVELVSFNALLSGNNVVLSWKTASELNNSGFEIQRKTENSNWNKIGFVQGAGTSTESRSYSFSDPYS
ncbi:MAG: T9SS C-terminal target domain-containing protein, partial [Bacteroidia bacterium]|nr:T9SS C-terminal target domain-containing protein [Bacteroidia bacterium]